MQCLAATSCPRTDSAASRGAVNGLAAFVARFQSIRARYLSKAWRTSANSEENQKGIAPRATCMTVDHARRWFWNLIKAVS